MKNYIKYVGILALGLVACEPEFENPVDEQGAYSSGDADFTNYVALGNSLTAGYADNALYITGQENSYPNILAQQFAKAQETGEFRQPLMADNAGGLLLNGNPVAGPRLVLAFDAQGNPSPRAYTGRQTSTDIANRLSGSFNNMGVPGAKSFHLGVEGYGNVAGVATGAANPYFARFASADNATVIGDAVAQNPTFFSLWIGNNDVLSFATSGGAGIYQDDMTVSPAEYGPNDITNPQVFAAVYSGLVDALLASGAEEGVLLNIPNVTDVPYFTTVPVNAIPLDEQTAAMLNANFQAYNEQILPGLANFGAISPEEMARRQISFSAGQNFVTLVDEDLTDISGMLQQPPFSLDAQTAGLLAQLRQATSADLIPLPSSSVLGQVVGDDPTQIRGVSVPLGDEHVLTAQEQELVVAATQAYNQVIRQVAEANDLAFVDAAAMLEETAGAGIAFDGGVVTSEFATGGAFSLDGIHLTPRGNALVANRIIDAINSAYGASVPRVNIGNYATVTPSQDVN